MKQAFFITGTDTGVGKTHVTCALLHATRLAGLSTVGMKPIASGVEDDGRNGDVTQILAASSIQAPPALINPYLFIPPIAPHLAAQETGQVIDFTIIGQAFHELSAQVDVVWVEGVGGFLVPLGEQTDSSDLVRYLGLPLILVVGMRLGCINHTLLTIEALQARGLVLAGWVANRVDAAMTRFETNLDSLRDRIAAPFLGVIPYGTNPARAAPSLHLAALSEFATLADSVPYP